MGTLKYAVNRTTKSIYALGKAIRLDDDPEEVKGLDEPYRKPQTKEELEQRIRLDLCLAPTEELEPWAQRVLDELWAMGVEDVLYDPYDEVDDYILVGSIYVDADEKELLGHPFKKRYT